MGTSGTTSAAPTHGCAPSCRRRSIRSRAQPIPASSASTSSSSPPTRVYTDRLWSSSEWMSSRRACAESASPIASIVARSRPSEKLGTASSGSIGMDPTLRGDDRPQVLLPLARLARARPRALPRLRRGRLPARVAARARAGHGATGIHIRTGSRRRRGRGTPAVAWASRPDAPPLARARRGRGLRDLLLRLGHALLSRSRRVGPRRPDADAARAGALLLLAGVGARASAAAPDRHGRGARVAAAARALLADAVHRRAVRAPGDAARPAPPSLRRERLAQRPGQPRAVDASDRPRTPRACVPLENRTPRYIQRNERGSLPAHFWAASLVPQALQARRRDLDRLRRRLAGGADRPHLGHGTRRDRPGTGRPGHLPALALRRCDRGPRPCLVTADARPPADLGPAGTGRRDGHAPGDLLAPRAPVIRLLRPSPDGAADVARDGRPAGRAVLPRLRLDLLLPERPDRGVRDRRPLLLRVAACARGPRGHAVHRRARLPLQPRRTPDSPRRPAEARRRLHGRRGEHRRRPCGESVRAGARRGGEVPRPERGTVRPDDPGEPAARDLRAAPLLRAAPRAGGRAARRRAYGRGRVALRQLLRRLQPLPRTARDAAPLTRNVDRPGTACDRLGRTDLRGPRRTGGGRRQVRGRRVAAGRRRDPVRGRRLFLPPRAPRTRGGQSHA